MNNPVDIVQFVNDLPTRRRGRACIVLTHKFEVQKEWAAELARQTNFQHLDLLEHFTQNSNVIKKIVEFHVSMLFEFLTNFCEDSVLIVSNIEFLKATWSGQIKSVDEFTNRVENWARNPALLFVIQHDERIVNRNYRRFPQYRFVVDQNETLDL